MSKSVLTAPARREKKTAVLNVRLTPSMKETLAKIAAHLQLPETDTVEFIILETAKNLPK